MPFIRFLRCSTVHVALILPSLLSSSMAFAEPIQTATLKTLSTFLAELEANHPQLQVGKAQQAAASANIQAVSQPRYNPELEVDAERVGFAQNKVNTVTLGISQALDWHDKGTARKNIAIAERQVTMQETAAARQQLIAAIFAALADYQMQQQIIQSHSKRLSVAKQVLAQAIRRYQAGDISKLDLEQIRLNQTQTQLTLNQAITQLARSEKALIVSAGVQRKSWPALPDAPPPIQLSQLNYEQMLNNLPVLKAEAARVVVAYKQLKLRVREQKADPSIGFRIGSEGSNKIMGLTLSMPLNVRNNFSAEVDVAKAHIQRAENIFNNQKHQQRTRLQSAAETYQLTYAAWQSWQKVAGNSLQKQTALLMRLWKAGELSTSDYLVQLNQIKQAQFNHVELKGNVWKSWFNWLASNNQIKKWLKGHINTTGIKK